MITRAVEEGRVPQGVREAVRYRITVKGAPPVSALDVLVTDESAGAEDVTLSTVTGSPSVQGGVLVLPLIANLTAGHTYRVEARYSDGTSTLGVTFEIEAER